MALLIMIVRKMYKNRLLELCLLFGLIITVALSSSMPIYSNAILQRMLVHDMQNLQTKTNQYPGKYYASVLLDNEPDPAAKQKKIAEADAFIKNTIAGFGIPIVSQVTERTTSTYPIVSTDPARNDPKNVKSASISALSGMEEHIRLVDGKMPAAEPVDGTYEALVTDSALTKLNMVLGNEFIVEDKFLKKSVKIKPVGVFDIKDPQDLYWAFGLGNYSSSFLIPFGLFEKQITNGHALSVKSTYWYSALNYEEIQLQDVQYFLQSVKNSQKYLNAISSFYTVNVPAQTIVGDYFEKEKKLRLVLWSLNVPVLIMLAFYLYMVANLIMSRQKTEIAVLRSRGASRLQIMTGYVIEGMLLGAIAYALGPPAGMQLTKVLGAANGFLEFVQRSTLDVRLSAEAYQYGLIAVVCSLVMTLVPAFLATRTTIVGHKQQMARLKTRSFWHVFFIDVILIAISLYGLQSFKRRMDDLSSLALNSLDFKIDPLLFLVPALFVLGAALIVLRIYPWVIRLVYWIGKKWWSPSLYATLIQVGRSGIQYQFIMVFISMTIATGMFNASAARTLNTNAEEQIMYMNGADINMQLVWENDGPTVLPENTFAVDERLPAAPPPPRPGAEYSNGKLQYSEPPFLSVAELPSVEHAAKVFVSDTAKIKTSSRNIDTRLMAIDTDDFGRVVWFRNGLLGHHINEYLNLMAVDPSAILVSRSIADDLDVKPGDHVTLSWMGTDQAAFIVYGIIDYWPSWNPNPQPAQVGRSEPTVPKLVVGHLSYVQNNIGLDPYSIWLKLKPGVTSEQFYEQVSGKGLPLERLDNARQEVIKSKNDPYRMAINGVMTLGFMISALISFFGFMLYWVLSLSGRVLQLGILRAMGISRLQLIGMLACEQLLTSGAAIAIGFGVGSVTGRLFVPLFQLSVNPATQVPPFRVIFDPTDQLRMYVIVSVMVLLGLSVLSYMLSRIKIHQAVKLGED